MPFIHLHPLEEQGGFDPAHLGQGHPARCRAQSELDAAELYVAVGEIAAFEGCPLYLVSRAEDNALVNGIRMLLRCGRVLVVADDPEDEADGFLALLARAAAGEIVHLPHSRYLEELARKRLI